MDKIIERADILTTIKNRAAEMINKKNEPTRMIINIHGMFGMGKTYVLQQIVEAFRQDYAMLSLNCDPVEQDQSEHKYAWSDILSMLQAASLLPALSEQIIFPDEQIKSIHEIYVLCTEEREYIEQQLAQDKPLLLLLDNLDDLPYWKWIQEKVIKPLIEQERVLVITTSQSPLFWHFWELREQCEPIELHPFSYEQTRSFLALFGKDALTETLYNVTGGYPLGLAYLIRLLDAQGNGSTPEPDDILLAEYRAHLLQELNQQLPERAKKHDVNMGDLLKTLVELKTPDLTSLKKQMNLRPGQINDIIASLMSRGFVSQNRQNHTYHLKPLLQKNIYPHIHTHA